MIGCLVSVVLLGGCGASDGGEASAGVSAESTATSSSPTTSEAADPTGGSVPQEESSAGHSPGGGSAADRTEEGPSPHGPSHGDGAEPGDTGSTTTGGGSDGGTEGLPGWPIESIPVHGGELWGAYLAVGQPGDPQLQEVLAAVQQSWPGAGTGELGCDHGAAEALGRDRTEHAVAVYFATEQHITEFRRRWDGPYLGAVRVTTYCAD